MANPSQRVPECDSVHGRAVRCASCLVLVDLSQPLTFSGWQAVHRCLGFEIEALAYARNRPPCRWRGHDRVAWRRSR